MQQSIFVLLLWLVLATGAAARPPYAPGKDPSEQVPAVPVAKKSPAAPARPRAAIANAPGRGAEPVVLPESERYEQAGPGDSLFAISRRRQVPLRALIEANGLEPPFSLIVGQYLRLPPPRIHLVEADETLFSVSRRFNVDLRSLALLNALEKPWMVAAGDRLMLPALARDNQEAPPGTGPSDPVGARTAPRVLTSVSQVPAIPAQGATTPAPTGAGTGPAGPVRFRWPARGAVLRSFGPQPGGQRLDGLQMALPPAAPVSAAAAGIVVYRGEDLPGFGKLMLLRHEGGWVTAYAHLGRFLAEEGSRVQPGQAIAEAGRPPSLSRVTSIVREERAAQDSLHFEIRNPKGRPVDPQALIGRL